MSTYAEMQKAKIAPYIQEIAKPSDDFTLFLRHYFIGHPMIKDRGEEDITVWDRLQGQELAVAKQLMLDFLGRDAAYIRALGYCKEERAVPKLEEIIKKTEKFVYVKLMAAKALYEINGYPDYFKTVEEGLLSEGAGTYTKINLDAWLENIEDDDFAFKIIFLMLRDKEGFVRFCALKQLNVRLERQSPAFFADSNFYAHEDVYADKEVFESRLCQLWDIVHSLQSQ